MKVEDLHVYQNAMELAEDIWGIVLKWSFFERDTIGKQLVRATDSVAANIAEGYGRYHFKENKNFLYYARGSLYETKTWLQKSFTRKLINEEQFNSLMTKINKTGIKLNNYINTIGKNYQ